jgi:hypothetical protein
MIAASNGHLLAFDNLSGLPGWLSDALCRLATGGSFAVRQLYTDDEEVLFRAARPTESRMSSASQIWQIVQFFSPWDPLRTSSGAQKPSFGERPRILGALLDAAARGLRALGCIHFERLPRMADFALWAAACEKGLWPAGTFARAYAANRKASIEGLIDADPVASCVRELMTERDSWTGSASDLLRSNVDRNSNEISRIGWPKNPRALAGHLRRAQTFLRTLGIEITFGREGRAGTRIIRISTSTENTVSTVSSVRDNRSSFGGYGPLGQRSRAKFGLGRR